MEQPPNHPLGGFYYQSDQLRRFGFKNIGENVSIHSRASIYLPENIQIGSNVRIDDFTVVIATGPVFVGSNVHIPTHCFIGARNSVFIDDYVTFAPHVQLYTASDDYKGNHLTGAVVPRQFTGGDAGPVIIRRHAIIGAGTVILPNCEIGEGAAIGALSLVKCTLPPWQIYAGVPAKRIATRDRSLLNLT